MVRRLVLTMLLIASLAVPSAATAATTTNVTIQSATLVNNFQVQVTGTIQCTQGEQYFVSVTVLQRGPGQTSQEGSGSTSGICSSNTNQGWIVTVTGGPFSPGKALILASGQVCGFTSCAFDQDDRTIRLRHA
jgi:hypothetical protein